MLQFEDHLHDLIFLLWEAVEVLDLEQLKWVGVVQVVQSMQNL